MHLWSSLDIEEPGDTQRINKLYDRNLNVQILQKVRCTLCSLSSKRSLPRRSGGSPLGIKMKSRNRCKITENPIWDHPMSFLLPPLRVPASAKSIPNAIEMDAQSIPCDSYVYRNTTFPHKSRPENCKELASRVSHPPTATKHRGAAASRQAFSILVTWFCIRSDGNYKGCSAKVTPYFHLGLRLAAVLTLSLVPPSSHLTV